MYDVKDRLLKANHNLLLLMGSSYCDVKDRLLKANHNYRPVNSLNAAMSKIVC